MFILGISAYYHDSAACLIKEGKIIAAVSEERFTRKKHEAQFPKNAINDCLKQANSSLFQVDYITFYEKPFLKFERLLETYLTEAPKGYRSFLRAIPIWIKEKLFLKKILIDHLFALTKESQKISCSKKETEKHKNNLKEKLLFAKHHHSHAASAFYPSPFKKAAILTIDGVGEWTTTSLAYGTDNKIEFLSEITFPHSLGLLYSAITYYTGFKVNSGEYKVMGLAPYGRYNEKASH